MKKFKIFLMQFAVSDKHFWMLFLICIIAEIDISLAFYPSPLASAIINGIAFYPFIVAVADLVKSIDEYKKVKKELKDIE